MNWQNSLVLMVYPELRQYPSTERREALERARKGSLDTVEWIGILPALVLVAVLTRYSAQGLGLAQALGVALANFFAALGLLFVFAGPFLLRRTRRHLALGSKRRNGDK